MTGTTGTTTTTTTTTDTTTTDATTTKRKGMDIPARDTTRSFYIAFRNVKGVNRFACFWTDTDAYVRDSRVSKNDASFVYNPQIFSASYARTLEKMRAIFPNATLTEYAGTIPNADGKIPASVVAETTTGRVNVNAMRGTVTTGTTGTDVPARTEEKNDTRTLRPSVSTVSAFRANAETMRTFRVKTEDATTDATTTTTTTGRTRKNARTGRK